jgi:hypothetical protein
MKSSWHEAIDTTTWSSYKRTPINAMNSGLIFVVLGRLAAKNDKVNKSSKKQGEYRTRAPAKSFCYLDHQDD